MIKNRLHSTEHRQQNKDYMTQNSVCRAQKNVPGSENGFVLILTLLLLLVATVVGITALSTSTTNVMITGNQRLNELNFAAADSGVSVSVPIINDTAFNRAVSSKYAPLVKTTTTDFVNEITGALPMDSDDALISPDLGFTLGGGATTVSVDVDYLYAAPAAGSAIEFASGYEGAGKGAGAGGVNIYYDILSVGQGLLGSEDEVCALYRYVSK